MIKGINKIKMNLALSQKNICLIIKTDEKKKTMIFNSSHFRLNLLYYSLVYL